MLSKDDASNNIELQSDPRDRARRIPAWTDSLTPGGVRPTQLLDVIHRLAPEMSLRARWRAIEVQINVPDSLPAVDAIDEDMEHLLSNLINNAIKYTDPGGTVTVTLW